MSDPVLKVRRYIYDMKLIGFESPSAIVTGVSGGADSVCLLLLLKRFSVEFGFSVHAVHVNHNLRGDEAYRDQEFVRRLCGRLNVPLRIFSEDVSAYASENGLSLEEAGRNLRYRRFAECASETGADIAVAHNLDDNAETVLFNMIRGTGLSGLSGINPVSFINGQRVIRPLLCLTRAEIERYLDSADQDFCVDRTNLETEYTRNRIRHNILSEMKKINPKAAEHICRAAVSVKDAWELIDEISEEAFSDCVSRTGEAQEFLQLDIKKADRYKAPVLDDLIYKLIKISSGRSKDISDAHVRSVRELIDAGNGKSVQLPERIRAVNKNGYLVFAKDITAGTSDECRKYSAWKEEFDPKKIPDEGFSFGLPDGRKVSFETVSVNGENRKELKLKNEYTKSFDCGKISGNLCLRTRREGDMISFGRGSKTLGRFFIDEKIPRDERDRIFLLCSGNSVLWILGGRMSAAYMIDEKTEMALRVTVS